MNATTPSDGLIQHVAVVVPAFNEQDTIDTCVSSVLTALARARQTRPHLTTELVVVLDRCTDATAEIVSARPEITARLCVAGLVGAARADGSAYVAATSPASPQRTWTAHTDADSEVHPDWLVHQLDLADAGACVMLGTVVLGTDEPLQSVWSSGYDARDGHAHVHGANFGVRADVLHSVGGWRACAEHEDVDLARRVAAAGYPIARTGRFAVRTSARTVGRTPGGMAGYLRDASSAVRNDRPDPALDEPVA